MLRLAILSARGRLGTFAGALIALFAAAVLAMAWGMQLESVLRTHPPVERYAAAAAVVTGQQKVGADHDVLLSERARVSSALAARLAAVAGRPSGDRRRVGAGPARRHGPPSPTGGRSAALTPYVLSAGRPPAGPDEVVTGYPAALGTRLRLASTEAARTVTVVGVARPRHPVRQQTAIFLTDAEAARLAGHPGTGRRDRRARRPRLRRLAPARRRSRRGGAHRRRARPGRVSRAPADADHADPRHGSVRRTGAVHRDVRRGQHDGPVDPAARARDRAAASGGRDARSDPPHDRLGGDDRRPGRLGGRNLARDHPRPSARTRARAPRHRPAELRRPHRLAARSRQPSAARSRRRCSPCWPPGGARPECRRRSRSPTPRSSRGCWAPGAMIGGLLALAGAVPLFTVSTTTSTPRRRPRRHRR